MADSRRDCEAEMQVLQPGGEDRYDVALPEALAGGSHRFSTRVQVGDARIEEVYSPAFLMPEPTPPDSADAESAS